MSGNRSVASPGEDVAASTFRCFLFADLRGYTTYLEKAGNAAGAQLVAEYTKIVRDCVAEHNGAEIKVEGDGFHVVFPSASSAVMCGVAITQAAAEATAAHPDRPIHVGVGIHAGEAIETADGFIGSAVNIAARACAAAASGEVLVTGVVRGIVRSSVPVEFVSMGRSRLKGVPERIELFAAVPVGGTAVRRRRPQLWVAGAVAAAAVVLVVVGIVLAGAIGRGPSVTPAPTGPMPVAIGALAVGRYVASDFNPRFTFTIDDPGWDAYRHQADGVGLQREGEPPNGRLDIGRVRAILADACNPEGQTLEPGPTPGDFIAALRDVPYLEVSADRSYVIGGNNGSAVDIAVLQGAQAACGFGEQNEIAIFQMGEDTWGGNSGERFTLRAVAVNGETLVFLLSAEQAMSVTGHEAFNDMADRVIGTIDF